MMHLTTDRAAASPIPRKVAEMAAFLLTLWCTRVCETLRAGLGSADSKTTSASDADRASDTSAVEDSVTVMVQLPPLLSRYEGRRAHLE